MSTNDTATNQGLASISIEELQKQFVLVKEQNSQLQKQVDLLTSKLQELLRLKYGPKTERFIPNEDQLRIFGDVIQETTAKEVATEEIAPPQKELRGGHSRKAVSKNLERRRKILKPNPEDLICSCCGKEKQKVNEVVQYERYEYIPSSIFIEEAVREVYACEKCSDGSVTVAPKAAEPISNGKAGAGLLSYISVNRWCDHLPLYRQEKILGRHGVEISRSTMCDWLAATTILLRPLYALMKRKVLESRIIWTDDTPVKVQDKTLKNKIREGRVWAYLGDKEHPYTLFDYTPTRKRDGPQSFLQGFKGYLQADCFNGYDCIYATSDVLEVACMAHARRYFVKAYYNNKIAVDYVLKLIRDLYDIEKEAKSLSTAERKESRQNKAKPILETMKKWLDNQLLIALPNSLLGKAVKYNLNNWDALCRYIDDGDLSIDNNCSEREMKNIAIGRKNWLFFGSDNGGKTAEVPMSLIARCKRNNVEPFAYLKDVIQRLAENPNINLALLLPDKWQPHPSL